MLAVGWRAAGNAHANCCRYVPPLGTKRQHFGLGAATGRPPPRAPQHDCAISGWVLAALIWDFRSVRCAFGTRLSALAAARSPRRLFFAAYAETARHS